MPLANRLFGGGLVLAGSGMILYHLGDGYWLSPSVLYRAAIAGVALGLVYFFIKHHRGN